MACCRRRASRLRAGAGRPRVARARQPHVHTRAPTAPGTVDDVAAAAHARRASSSSSSRTTATARARRNRPAYRSGVLVHRRGRDQHDGRPLCRARAWPRAVPRSPASRATSSKTWHGSAGSASSRIPDSPKHGARAGRDWDAAVRRHRVAERRQRVARRAGNDARRARSRPTGSAAPETIAALFDRADAVFADGTRSRDTAGSSASPGTTRTPASGSRGNWEPTAAATSSLQLPGYESAFRAFAVRRACRAVRGRRRTTDAAALLDAIRAGHVFTVDRCARHARRPPVRGDGRGRPCRGRRRPRRGRAACGLEARVPRVPGVSHRARAGRQRSSPRRRTAACASSTGGLGAEPSTASRRAAERAGRRLPWIVGNPIYHRPAAAARACALAIPCRRRGGAARRGSRGQAVARRARAAQSEGICWTADGARRLHFDVATSAPGRAARPVRGRRGRRRAGAVPRGWDAGRASTAAAERPDARCQCRSARRPGASAGSDPSIVDATSPSTSIVPVRRHDGDRAGTRAGSRSTTWIRCCSSSTRRTRRPGGNGCGVDRPTCRLERAVGCPATQVRTVSSR